MYEGIMEELKEVSETFRLRDITRNEECDEEINFKYTNKRSEFCCNITEGVLLRKVLSDLIKQSQSKLTMYKTLQMISNEQLNQTIQQHNKELKKGNITTKECVVCHKEKDELINVFGCGHSYHSTCLKSTGI
ncbi:hypothetical protein EDI_110830 [Entamoeba dispar SAW760]|uniref:Vps8 RING finger domain-containing protein n=1 Tax=Entamoeba dispar (strain ATCC PRA-260 / SAW760) TaxID=370354 RepID=B0E714_ENTDS|nr:uncharacterized protein EDI_110830 [Entamoeba dispar SAW760]EDR29673.1 hypothetical protein EDI_110830 [Entamoeba dispar SAW760]|eukprot:EDR29673.1 hypothetical protein EDI_110830 [Entamoeba dispar SAW760]